MLLVRLRIRNRHQDVRHRARGSGNKLHNLRPKHVAAQGELPMLPDCDVVGIAPLCRTVVAFAQDKKVRQLQACPKKPGCQAVA